MAAPIVRANPLPTIDVGVDNFATGQVSVGSGATLIVAARVGRVSVAIIQHGTTPVYLGDSTVTNTTGVLLNGSAGSAANIQTTAAIYGATGGASQTVSFIEVW